METKDIDISEIVNRNVEVFHSFKTSVVNKDGKIFLRLEIGNLQELK